MSSLPLKIGQALAGPPWPYRSRDQVDGAGWHRRRVAAILSRMCRTGGLRSPKFLREGSEIQDFMRPDWVVIGTISEHAKAVMHQLYRPLYLIETPMLFTEIEIKCAANAFLATKITFVTQIGDLRERVGADVQDVASEAKKLLPDITYCSDAYEATEGATGLVLLTEWNEICALSISLIDLPAAGLSYREYSNIPNDRDRSVLAWRHSLAPILGYLSSSAVSIGQSCRRQHQICHR
jgi:hypothetical protein